MNNTITRALLLDALYQILDNKVFRLLVLLTMIPILFSFFVGFREDEIVFFFGLRTTDYESLLRSLGLPVGVASELRLTTIQAVQSLIIENLSGTVGILFCIAATAFFVPRMLERGTADTLFSKPVSRASLLIARYLSGVLFVFILSSVLVLGVHTGLTLVSGYSDPGFLWGILTLTYVFAMVHAVSTCIAVLTRSSVAAILCTLTFFVFNGCMHGAWMTKEHQTAMNFAKSEVEDSDEDPLSESDEPLVNLIVGFIDTYHYTMPKTSEAAILTRILRRSIEGEPELIEDPVGGLVLSEQPDFGEGTRAVRQDIFASGSPGFGIEWRIEDDSGETLGTTSILRTYRRFENNEDGSPGAEREWSYNSRTHSRYRPKELEEISGTSSIEAVRARAANRSASFVHWQTLADPEFQYHEEILFGYQDHNYLIASEWRGDWLTVDQREKYMDAFLAGASFPKLEEIMVPDPTVWMQKQMSLTAPLRFNILFSVGSSALFILVMLSVAMYVLIRIDF